MSSVVSSECDWHNISYGQVGPGDHDSYEEWKTPGLKDNAVYYTLERPTSLLDSPGSADYFTLEPYYPTRESAPDREGEPVDPVYQNIAQKEASDNSDTQPNPTKAKLFSEDEYNLLAFAGPFGDENQALKGAVSNKTTDKLTQEQGKPESNVYDTLDGEQEGASARRDVRDENVYDALDFDGVTGRTEEEDRQSQSSIRDGKWSKEVANSTGTQDMDTCKEPHRTKLKGSERTTDITTDRKLPKIDEDDMYSSVTEPVNSHDYFTLEPPGEALDALDNHIYFTLERPPDHPPQGQVAREADGKLTDQTNTQDEEAVESNGIGEQYEEGSSFRDEDEDSIASSSSFSDDDNILEDPTFLNNNSITSITHLGENYPVRMRDTEYAKPGKALSEDVVDRANFHASENKGTLLGHHNTNADKQSDMQEQVLSGGDDDIMVFDESMYALLNIDESDPNATYQELRLRTAGSGKRKESTGTRLPSELHDYQDVEDIRL